MKLWMSEMVQADVGQSYGAARKEIERKINEKIHTSDYGESIERWTHIGMVLHIAPSDRDEVRRFSKARKTVEFRLKIDHAPFKSASPQGQRKLIVASLLRSIKMMPQLKIKDFQWSALLQDVSDIAWTNGWLDPDEGGAASIESRQPKLHSDLSSRDVGPPKLITIDPDDDCANRIGHMADGRQFFLTTPFVPQRGENPGCEFIALYIFDRDGRLTEARVDKLGPREQVDDAATRALIQQRLDEIAPIRYGRIQVRPFEIRRHGTKFGLVPRPPEGEDDTWWVEAHPGNYMAFHPPWDSGEYDT